MMFDTTNIHMQQRILIIDDDRELAQTISELLLDEGFAVETACNGRDGIRLQNANPYDLIITDIVMPEEDGLEVIMWVRKTHPNTKLIAISGGGYFDSCDYLLMAKELGAKLVLVKPFEIKSLLSGVRRLLGIEKPA